MNITILVCAIGVVIFYILFGVVAAYCDACDAGFKWYRFIFVMFFYGVIDLWCCIKGEK